jgi:phosphoribosylformimino-5-aminoimidazole carboxamide ribotide isomerase
MKIFPAIDIKDKKCVRLVKGDFDKKTEYELIKQENLKIMDLKIYT